MYEKSPSVAALSASEMMIFVVFSCALLGIKGLHPPHYLYFSRMQSIFFSMFFSFFVAGLSHLSFSMSACLCVCVSAAAADAEESETTATRPMIDSVVLGGGTVPHYAIFYPLSADVSLITVGPKDKEAQQREATTDTRTQLAEEVRG